MRDPKIHEDRMLFLVLLVAVLGASLTFLDGRARQSTMTATHQTTVKAQSVVPRSVANSPKPLTTHASYKRSSKNKVR